MRSRRAVAWRLIRLGAAAAAALAATAIVGPGAARAADEDEWRVSGRAGMASVAADGRDPLGIGIGLSGEYGITDSWAVHLDVNVSRHGVDANPQAGLPGGAVKTRALFGGLTYTMDVLRLVPYFQVGLGFLSVSGSVKQPRQAIGMEAGAGADYLLNPRWAVGAIAEYVYAPFDLIANALSGAGVPQAYTLALRVSWVIR